MKRINTDTIWTWIIVSAIVGYFVVMSFLAV